MLSISSILKSPLVGEHNAGKRRAELVKGGRRRTNQRGKYALSRRPPGIVPAAKMSPWPLNLIAPFTFRGIQILDHPYLTGRLNAADKVPIHHVGGSCDASGATPLETGMTPIPPLNFANVSSADTDKANNPPREDHKTSHEQNLFHDVISLLLFLSNFANACQIAIYTEKSASRERPEKSGTRRLKLREAQVRTAMDIGA